MKGTVEAVFQDGVLKPVQPLELSEGDRVRLTVERITQAGSDEILKLARQVYEGLIGGCRPQTAPRSSRSWRESPSYASDATSTRVASASWA